MLPARETNENIVLEHVLTDVNEIGRVRREVGVFGLVIQDHIFVVCAKL